MFFTRASYIISVILFLLGCIGLISPMVVTKAPAGMNQDLFITASFSMFYNGAIMIGISICLGVLAEISQNIAKKQQ